MTYKQCNFNVFCHIRRYLRVRQWIKISRPLSKHVWDNSKAITKHFNSGSY